MKDSTFIQASKLYELKLSIAEARVRSQVTSMAFVVDQAALWQALLRVLRLSPLSTIPLLIRIHPHLHATLTIRTSGRGLGNLKKKIENRLSLQKKVLPLS